MSHKSVLMISNISPDLSGEELQDSLAEFGDIVSFVMERPLAVACYRDLDSAFDAEIALDGYAVKGSNLEVKAQPEGQIDCEALTRARRGAVCGQMPQVNQQQRNQHSRPNYGQNGTRRQNSGYQGGRDNNRQSRPDRYRSHGSKYSTNSGSQRRDWR